MAKSSLGALKIGGRAIVQAVRCGHAETVRLLEMGLLPGTEVKVIRRAPMGDPLELSFRGYRLSIRTAQASLIEVQPLAT